MDEMDTNKQINSKNIARDNINLEKSDLENIKVLERTIAFSDGVFAFAITLLIVDIQLPAVTSENNLGSILISLWPNYLAFVISFLSSVFIGLRMFDCSGKLNDVIGI